MMVSINKKAMKKLNIVKENTLFVQHEFQIDILHRIVISSEEIKGVNKIAIV